MISSQTQAALQQQQQQQQQGQQQQQNQPQHQQQQLSYSVIPQMQTVNIDGQEALFIPSSAMSSVGTHHQASPTMQFATAGGQQVQLASQQVQLANGQTIITPQPVSLIRAPNGFPSIIQNFGQTVQLPTGLFSTISHIILHFNCTNQLLIFTFYQSITLYIFILASSSASALLFIIYILFYFLLIHYIYTRLFNFS